MLLAASCAPAAGLNDAATGRRLAAMRDRLGSGFLVEREGIFLIAGNLTPPVFERIRVQTIRLCAEAMWETYFQRKPDYPILICLFADDASYRHWAKDLFADTEVSHFGYYRPGDHTLVMNIGTGTGTLVHEMTHALIRPDFPSVPTWFDEGLASLHEQCQVAGDRIVGLVNWRLPELQKAIEAGRLVPLAALVATSDAEFRGEERGLHYAEARYLAMYLQQRGLLERFYRQFRDGHKGDPTGAKTLAAVTGHSLQELERDWVAWVKTLRFPPR